MKKTNLVNQERIKVLARIRPLNNNEKLKNNIKVIESTEQSIQFNNNTLNSSILNFTSRRFVLDAVLNEDSTQEEVFYNIILLLESFLNGYNCTVFTCKSIRIISEFLSSSSSSSSSSFNLCCQ